MRILLLSFFLAFNYLGFCQQSLPEKDAEFPGGNSAIAQFIVDNVQYPPKAMRRNWQGQIIVTFIVETDGTLTDIQAQNGKKVLRQEAERLIYIMPRWTPGEANGKIVRTRCTLPINFQLTD